MPNHRMNSGNSAIFGIGNSAETTATPGERKMLNSPIDQADADPGGHAERKAAKQARERCADMFGKDTRRRHLSTSALTHA